MERDGVAVREIEATGRSTKWTWIAGLLLFAALLLSAPASALAGTAEEISALPSLDTLSRSESPLSGSGKWSALAWDNSTSSHNTGRVTETGWGPYDAFATVNGAYWNPATFNDTSGEAAAMTMAIAPGNAERYLALWLDMASPGSAKSGYQLRWVVTSGSTYAVTLAKFSAGTETVLASASGVSIAAGQTLAISDTGGTVTAWKGSSGSLTQLLTASDSSYSSGYAGIEGSGNISHSTAFKAGALVPPPDTTITAGPKGLVVPNVTFSFSGTNSPSGFECALDSGTFEACSSPKSYSGLGEGSHSFRVRAVNGAGADATPAERSFQVLAAAKAVTKTPVLDNFERSEVPLATGKFTKPSWAGAIGGAWMGSYRGYGSSGGLAGAYWNQGTFSDGGEATVLVSGVVGTGATPAGQYLALWLDMPEPATARSGYEARFTGGGSASSYTVELAKWVAGTRTVLASASGFTLAVGTTMALSETAGGSLALWTGTSALTPALTAVDSTYSSGYAGLEVNGGAGTIYNFRAGRIDLTPPETTITSGPTGTVVPAEASFGFSSSEAGSSFECTLDAAAFSACSSPKSYSAAAAGAHTFKVRALDAVGNQDETPAERSFTLAPPPTVTTTAASGVKKDQASLTGTVNPNGAATTYQFEYGTTTAYGAKVPASAKAIGQGTAALEVTEPITGLTVGTTYHYRLLATNGAGTTKGEDKTFTTAAAPTATSEAATELSASEAKLNATINPNGAATSYQFEYGSTTAYGSVVPASPEAIGSGSAAVAIAKQITGLSEGSTYHYRVVAENEAGKAYGADQTFATPLLPVAATESGEAVNANEAILVGEVDPNGTDTDYRFEYGTTQAYGSESAIGLEEAGDGQQPVTVGEPIAELKPSTTYHYRVVATSAAGTDHGADKSFTTAASGISEAEEVKAEEDEDAGISASATPGDFPGMMWSGDLPKMTSEQMAISVKESGADWFRLTMHESQPENQVEAVFREMAKRGITVLPYFTTGGDPAENDPGQKKFIEDSIRKYGPHGSFWADKAKKAPAIWWEIGNEPNRGDTVPGGVPKPVEYGRFFAHMASAARGADSSVQILFAGMYSASDTKLSDCGEPSTCKMRIGEFIDKAKQGIAAVQPSLPNSGSFDGVSVHPYVFKVNGNPIGENDVKAVMKKLRGYVREAHLAAGSKPVWITEFGFPTPYDGTAAHINAAPPVSEALQGKLIEAAFKKFKGVHDRFNVAHAFYYNIMDQAMTKKEDRVWSWASGLRLAPSGKVKRPGWEAYAHAAGGNAKWPAKPNVKKRPLTSLRPTRAGFAAGISNDGSGTSAHFQYWKPGGTSPPVTNTTDQPIEGSEFEKTFQQEVSGLEPLTTYMVHAVATNEENDTTVGENEEFTTPPSTSTSTNVTRVLHGQPGWVWIDGWVKEGEITGPLPGLSNVHVHVRLYRNGQFQRFVDVMTNAEGHYDSGYIEVGKGDWEVSTEFPGGGEWDRSETVPPKTFTVRDGVRIRAQHSGGCWDIFGAQQQNGAAVMHGACNEPVTSNQVFELVPQEGGQYLNIVARNSGRCVDVDNASTADGAGLQQYDCLGAGQSNQLFREAWSGNWLSYVAKHSNKCVDVTGASQGWINLQQWTCNASPQQAYRLEPVESGPKPTETFISTSHILHGNGQYGNWGLISASGHLLAGAYSMENRVVQVEFEKLIGGNYVRTDNLPLSVNAQGEYRFNDYGLSTGIWRVRTEFIGNGEYQGSASEWHNFSIFQANRLVSRNSGKCLSLSENRNVNGQHLIQWDCAGTGSLQDGQTFWFWPLGNHIYEITVVSSGKCLDIANGSTGNGAVLQQWDCNGYPQQKWELFPMAGQTDVYALRPQHSGKCLDVAGVSTGNGAEVWQWDCHWGANQQWIVYGVVGG